ncbi:ABC transporter family substrate-binding protein [Catenulispora yoronensis]
MRSITKKSPAIVAILATAALAASACSSSKSGSSGASSASTSANGKAIPAATSNDINAKDASSLKAGGTLTMAIDQYSSQWNIATNNGNELDSARVMSTMMPRLFHFDASGAATPNKDYLLSADESTASGKQVVTYKLNPKAKWSDGTAISYKDFVATWKAEIGASAGFDVASSVGYDQMESVERGADDQTVVVTYKTPFSDWKSMFDQFNGAGLYPAAKVSDVDGWNKAYLNAIPVTAGPFKLDKMDPTTKTVTVVADPNWWGDKPVLDKIVFRAIDDTAAQADAYNNHELDVFEVGPSAANFAKVKDAAGSTLHYAGGPDWRHITINTQAPALKDPVVRQAIYQAVNRQQIADVDLKNLGTWKPTVLNNRFFVNNQTGYQDNLGDLAYNVDAANKALDAAGWVKGGDGIRAKDGVKLDLKWVESQGIKVTSNEAQMVKADLQKVGINITETPVNGDDYFDKYINVGQYDITAFAYAGNPFPVSSGAPRSSPWTTRRTSTTTPAWTRPRHRRGPEEGPGGHRPGPGDSRRQRGGQAGHQAGLPDPPLPAPPDLGHQVHPGQLRLLRLPGLRLDEGRLHRLITPEREGPVVWNGALVLRFTNAPHRCRDRRGPAPQPHPRHLPRPGPPPGPPTPPPLRSRALLPPRSRAEPTRGPGTGRLPPGLDRPHSRSRGLHPTRRHHRRHPRPPDAGPTPRPPRPPHRSRRGLPPRPRIRRPQRRDLPSPPPVRHPRPRTRRRTLAPPPRSPRRPRRNARPGNAPRGPARPRNRTRRPTPTLLGQRLRRRPGLNSPLTHRAGSSSTKKSRWPAHHAQHSKRTNHSGSQPTPPHQRTTSSPRTPP